MIMEFLLAGVAACGAGFFTNPLDVVKTRMQLQGELKACGKYTIHYKNVFHAFYVIGRSDGILALQSGLVPALWYQLFMNGIRLGAYQCFINMGLTKDSKGNSSIPRSIFAGAVSGTIGAWVGSPIYMIKTQMQAQSANSSDIAVGHQHKHKSMTNALTNIYHLNGIPGLWRGVHVAMSRVMVGSAIQLSTFTNTKEYVVSKQVFRSGSMWNTLSASMLSGVSIVLAMTPLDVMSTRTYNQPADVKGNGVMYKNMMDCAFKIGCSEVLWGFYKGWAASLFRLGPHTVLSLLFWDRTRQFYIQNVSTIKMIKA